jgi:hypothetical protein
LSSPNSQDKDRAIDAPHAGAVQENHVHRQGTDTACCKTESCGKLRHCFAGMLATPCHGQWLKYPTPGIPRTADGKPDLNAPAPKTADGKPDLSGIWRANAGGYSLDVTSDLRPGEIQPWAAALYKQRVENFGKDNPAGRCFPTLGPGISAWLYKIVQTSEVIAFLPEAYPLPSAFRQILVDGRELPEDPNPTWQGYSVGHWDGDTLVIESAGFNDKTWLDLGGHPHTEELRVTERFRRKDFGHMELKTTFEDPKAYARPWTVSIEVALQPDTELLEYVCNENERDFQHFVTTGEDQKKFRSDVKVAPQTLAKYAGIYESPAAAGKLTYEVTLVGDQLMVKPPAGGGRIHFQAESATTFSRAMVGDSIEFVSDAQGAVTHFIYRSTEEGERKAIRKAAQ